LASDQNVGKTQVIRLYQAQCVTYHYKQMQPLLQSHSVGYRTVMLTRT